MSKQNSFLISIIFYFILFQGCKQKMSSHEEMIGILKKAHQESYHSSNHFHSPSKLRMVDSLLNNKRNTADQNQYYYFMKSKILLELGEEEMAVEVLKNILERSNEKQSTIISKELALTYLRLGERANCISKHAAESCILPIVVKGVHSDQDGSAKAIAIYKKLLVENPDDYESRWLMNIAYMTIGEYPGGVPSKFLIQNMAGDPTDTVRPFEDIAGELGLDVNNMAGGSVVEDFDNDGYLDIMTSSMDTEENIHYFKNNANGSFIDLSETIGLKGITGGLNMIQADYDNDGDKDVLVLRGAWKGQHGKEPNSLLRNNSDGTFTDVTTISGLLSFHPTQTATWNDFNNDGWLDLFIGNETFSVGGISEPQRCELFLSNKDGTFKEIARNAHCDVVNFVKGVTSGDYDNDGRKDIFISTMDGGRKLLRNMGSKMNQPVFEDVTLKAGLSRAQGRTFPTWFWDFDNDGWLDIFACDYTFEKSLAYYAGAEKVGVPAGSPEKMLLYRNNHDGTFSNVAEQTGLNKNVFAMGSNFGDIDNDGFLDMYLGSGNPEYASIVPNKMFRNIDGKNFADVTASARVGHLQKGHGVSFADMDNDGDQDIYIEMGGAFQGDAYQNSFFLNPGQNNNNWICIDLKGTKSNRDAIGTQIKLTFTENGKQRHVYRDVNSGGSFGASPLRREIGIGQATVIDDVQISWHGTDDVQHFSNVKPNQFISITQGSDSFRQVVLKTINWNLSPKLNLVSAIK